MPDLGAARLTSCLHLVDGFAENRNHQAKLGFPQDLHAQAKQCADIDCPVEIRREIIHHEKVVRDRGFEPLTPTVSR
jgi:hypothetical protein